MAEKLRVLVRGLLEETGVIDGLTKREAIALERIARGGGHIELFHFSRGSTHEIADHFRPGSIVSFYFDNRFESVESPQSLVFATLCSQMQHGGLLMAFATEGSPRLVVTNDVNGPDDLREFIAEAPAAARIFYGPFPAAENNGTRSITIAIPDQDGLTRHHPH